MEARCVTQAINECRLPRRGAADNAFPDIYAELRKIASSQRRAWRGNDTINTTALIHEAYLKLSQGKKDFKSRKHFYASAAKAMRQVLVNYAERGSAKKRFGIDSEQDVDSFSQAQNIKLDDILYMERLLSDLEDRNPRHCRIVECRVFGGMSLDETADVLDTSVSTVKREWLLISARLYRDLRSQKN